MASDDTSRDQTTRIAEWVRKAFSLPQPDFSLEEGLSQIGPGWRPILKDLWPNLQGVQVTTVKEKWGGLIVYINNGGLPGEKLEAVQIAMRKAEALSFKTCDFCGLPGTTTPRRMGWVRTRCTDHLRNEHHVETDPVLRKASITALLQSYCHLIVGGADLDASPQPNTDYLVSKLTQWLMRTLLSHHRWPFEYDSEIVHCPVMGINLIMADGHPILERVLSAEGRYGKNPLASVEALAAMKYAASRNAMRADDQRERDREAYERLVQNPGFDVRRFNTYLTGQPA